VLSRDADRRVRIEVQMCEPATWTPPPPSLRDAAMPFPGEVQREGDHWSGRPASDGDRNRSWSGAPGRYLRPTASDDAVS